MMPFVAPDWLANQNAEAIHKRMMEMLPNDIDDTEGGFPWDFTKPTALEKAELLEFFLVETLKIMHPMWAYGRWLDYHAAVVGLERKDANKAAGILTVTGKTGTNIVAGSRFAVPSIGDNPAIVYETRRQYTIGSEGTVDIEIFAVEGGTKFNVSAGAISLMLIPIQGITTLTNAAAITGGTEEESDE